MDIENIVKIQQDFFNNQTFDYEYRIKQLEILRQMLKNYEDDIYYALREDLNKSRFETLTTELSVLYTEIDFALKHLKDWMKPEKVKAPITHKGTKNYIYKEPYGVTLIISSWNYPLQLAIAPAIGAIAAGNTVIIKPSEAAVATSRLLSNMIETTFPKEYFTVVEGGKETNQALLSESFDYIFFTGSAKVGKIIMQKASATLTPVTLELGGKSPAIINQDANIKLAAKRVAWGKFTNAGQTCVAPDFIYVHDTIKTKFLRALIKQIKAFYGKNPLKNRDYVRIINHNHYKHVERFLDDEMIIYGGDRDEDRLLIAPTLLDNISWNDSVMQEEIFGPVLPILSFETLDDALMNIKKMEKPLALYYFGEDETQQDKVIADLSFGGGSINDTLYHLANPHLPFGGVGTSGMGSYHGKYSFNTFSHDKSIMKQTTKFDVPFRYPGGKLTETIIKKVMSKF
ncbi:aldehyde dehydrogenase [Virgibacillus sp. MSJ-26]|uniref:aldehyde dehydrogenase n=1 Tax=Virgibacillus sp. MSJ-26 TaxID=2841522 RepID=UPI001C127B0E|nr:aldehyde dehydrogenase [Virgibacillus sp. MSJ-26]MBU5466330.1 aldehyde dehydrogenase [Virgibacillus sp. MSJ-26]